MRSASTPYGGSTVSGRRDGQGQYIWNLHLREMTGIPLPFRLLVMAKTFELIPMLFKHPQRQPLSLGNRPLGAKTVQVCLGTSSHHSHHPQYNLPLSLSYIFLPPSHRWLDLMVMDPLTFRIQTRYLRSRMSTSTSVFVYWIPRQGC